MKSLFIFLFTTFFTIIASSVSNTIFELDGDATASPGKEDWDLLYTGQGTKKSFSGVTTHFFGVTIFL